MKVAAGCERPVARPTPTKPIPGTFTHIRSPGLSNCRVLLYHATPAAADETVLDRVFPRARLPMPEGTVELAVPWFVGASGRRSSANLDANGIEQPRPAEELLRAVGELTLAAPRTRELPTQREAILCPLHANVA